MKTKRIIAAVLALVCLSFAACNEKSPADTPANTTGGTAAVPGKTEGGTFPDLNATADAVKQYYGENVEFIFMADEYSDEVLQFTYGLMDGKFMDAVEDFVLTECDGMSADTFAVVKFKAGTDKALVEEAADIMKTEYVNGLKNKLAAYNPEEFAASDGYQVKVYDDSVMMVISSKNTEAIIAAATK
ncbi:MAG: DUF4358 domain-containing protein [Clostridia bacterium]|nr:DUF4358 domain-containing protein [Clostridia bacterium]